MIIINYLKKLEELIEQRHGTILSSDLDKYEIPRTYLSMLMFEGKLERVDRGIYVSTDAVHDEMYAMQNKYPKLIFSHETALSLHGLSDRTSFEYTATVPSGYKVVENVSERVKIYYIKKDLYESGIIHVNTPLGNPIKVYNIERTICDIVRSRSRVEIQILNEALKRFVKLKGADYSLLMDYAKEVKIESVLKNYLEVLL